MGRFTKTELEKKVRELKATNNELDKQIKVLEAEKKTGKAEAVDAGFYAVIHPARPELKRITPDFNEAMEEVRRDNEFIIFAPVIDVTDE